MSAFGTNRLSEQHGGTEMRAVEGSERRHCGEIPLVETTRTINAIKVKNGFRSRSIGCRLRNQEFGAWRTHLGKIMTRAR
jgi:hypothetical protein